MVLWCLSENRVFKLSYCAVCKKWIYKRYSSVCGDLLLVVGRFICKGCDGAIQEANLVVDGEAYGCVEFLLSWRHS